MKTLMRSAALAASVAALAALAQEDDFDFGVGGDEGTVEAADDADASASASDPSGGGDAATALTKKGGDARAFTALPFCRRLEGVAEVLKPGSTVWETIEEGKFYPLGSCFRTTEEPGRLRIQFGGEAEVELAAGAASFGTRIQPIGEGARAITLLSGLVSVKLPRSLADGLFKVCAPGFTVVNPKGESRYFYNRTGDGDVAVVRCVTGSLAIEGRHFRFPELKAANEVKIRSSQDFLFTGLYGNSGDCVVELDQGQRLVRDFSTGETSAESKPLAWKLSPKTAVRIHRALPEIGERMSVSVMTFDASGGLQNRCAFVEGRPEVNTGELGPVALADRDELARKAADAAAATTVDVSDIDEGADDSADASDGAAASDDDAPAAAADDDFDF